MKTSNRVYLWDTIYNRLIKAGVQGHDIDIRYLTRYFASHPTLFPKFMLRSSYIAYFNWEMSRWEIKRSTNLITFKY